MPLEHSSVAAILYRSHPLRSARGSAAPLVSARRPFVRLVALLLLVLHAGCYNYVPVGLDDLTAEAKVRARLSVQQANQMSLMFQGQDDNRTVEGTYLQSGPDSAMFLVPVVTSERRGRLETLNQRVNIPKSEILEVELKELNRRNTWLAAGTAIGLAVTAALAVILSDAQNGDGRPPEPPRESRIPVGLQLRF